MSVERDGLPRSLLSSIRGGDPLDTDTLASTPRVWDGCLYCYNSGRLVGERFEAVGADGVTPADMHRGAGGIRAGCEEMRCFDHENLPIRGEMSPLRGCGVGQLPGIGAGASA